MGAVSKSSGAMLMLAMFAAPAMGGLTAQAQEQAQEASDSEVMTTVYGQLPSPEEMTKGPKVEGIISARSDGRMQVTTADGNNTAIAIRSEEHTSEQSLMRISYAVFCLKK